MASQDSASLKSLAKPPAKSSAKAPAKSQKLHRTLQELESAFADWESLSSHPEGLPEELAEEIDQAKVDAQKKAKATEQNELEFRKKTKKLLHQLREQLAELND